MTYWPELVELFEYKIADALAGRVPRGGRRSLGELREELLAAPLEPALLRRVVEVDRQYRAHLKGSHDPKHLYQAPKAPVTTWSAPVTEDSAEVQAWKELHLMAWHDQARTKVQELSEQWHLEPSLLTLRVLFTVQENAERASQVGATLLPVPPRNDSLIDLQDKEVMHQVVQAFTELLLTEDGRKRVRNALSAVHEEPFPRHPDADVVAARVAAIERENLPPDAREKLVRALREGYNLDRDVRERPAIRDAVRALARQLEPILSSAPSPTMSGIPSHSLLYAEDQRSALRSPDDGAQELLINLRGGQATRWRGVDFRWQFIKPNWQIQANYSVVLMRPQERPGERVRNVQVTDQQFRAFISGDYLLLRVVSRPEEELGRRASLGRAVALLLDPSEAYGYLRMARATIQLLRDGRLEPETLSPASSAKYRSASQDALLNFARKGAATLCSRLARVPPEEATLTIHDAAALLNLPAERAVKLNEALHLAMHHFETLPPPLAVSRAELSADGAFLSLQIQDEPLTLQIGQRAVTLRQDFKGELAAVIAGYAALTLHDLLVIRIPEVSIILARQGNWLAAAALADTPESLKGGDTAGLLHLEAPAHTETQEGRLRPLLLDPND